MPLLTPRPLGVRQTLHKFARKFCVLKISVTMTNDENHWFQLFELLSTESATSDMMNFNLQFGAKGQSVILCKPKKINTGNHTGISEKKTEVVKV